MTQSIFTREELLDNYKNPYHKFKPAKFSHTSEEANISCGDEVIVYISVENNKVTAIHFEAQACALCIASASILATQLENSSITEIQKLTKQYITETLGMQLSFTRIKCAFLPLQAIQKALKN